MIIPKATPGIKAFSLKGCCMVTSYRNVPSTMTQ
jgi:hypothetical protein